jgi:hypothetical protein
LLVDIVQIAPVARGNAFIQQRAREFVHHIIGHLLRHGLKIDDGHTRSGGQFRLDLARRLGNGALKRNSARRGKHLRRNAGEKEQNERFFHGVPLLIYTSR